MDEAPQATRLRVALLADDGERARFRALLDDAGVAVVLEGSPGLPLPDAWNDADVLLVALVERMDRTGMERLLQLSPLPVLFNRGGVGTSEIWQRRLMGKLQTLAERALPSALLSSQRNHPELKVVRDRQGGRNDTPWLIVLGASIGGPKAVARFLQALPDRLPVAILVAQHISESCQELLVEQLDRCSDWPVALLGDGQTIAAGQVWLVPADNRIEMDAQGAIRRCGQAWESIYRPDIDAVLHVAAETFGTRCGAILFSGLGIDGARGCESISRHGGFVWAQSSESCVISNMPEAARRFCNVEMNGTPEELAQALTVRCQAVSASMN